MRDKIWTGLLRSRRACIDHVSKGWKSTSAVILFSISLSVSSSAQTFQPLGSFNVTNGEFPVDSPLVQGTNGRLYGTTSAGGAHNGGTVFEVRTGGGLVTIYNFCSQDICTDGFSAQAGLVQSTNGNLYGTTYGDESNLFGTVFEITASGKLATLHTFCSQNDCTDGADPGSGLLQSADGNFYGTTVYGGNNFGTIFEMTGRGKLITLHSFVQSDGFEPVGTLVQGTDGKIYGTTYVGGVHNYGTVFVMTVDGALTTLFSFANDSAGAYPYGGLMQATNGNLYGTTVLGGTNGQGTLFEISAGGELATLYSFCPETNCLDGAKPMAGLVQATDGNFYGTTSSGGTYDSGTIFEITGGGKFATLYSFCARHNCPDGSSPSATLMQSTDGNFYGTTYFGGKGTCEHGCGTVFSLSLGMAPFVRTLPVAGKVTAMVRILGNNLIGATGVTFNGTASPFTVVSGSEITTTVPPRRD